MTKDEQGIVLRCGYITGKSGQKPSAHTYAAFGSSQSSKFGSSYLNRHFFGKIFHILRMC